MNNPDNIPIQTPPDSSWYPPQKCYAIKGNIGCPCPKERPLLPEGVSLLSLPVAERQKYMWLVPDDSKAPNV